MKERKPFWGLLARRPCWLPTWRGWLALGLAVTLLLGLAVRNAYAFLAVNDPVAGGALVVEGWQPDYALEAAIAEFKRHPYEKLYVTGGPIDRGAPLSEYKTYAQLGAAILLRLGLDPAVVQAIPAPWVRQDRTYTSAVALREWLREHRIAPKNFHLLTLGPHARRSRLLFEEALGAGAKVGITAMEGRDYDPGEWWRSSEGFREVTGELIAYGYARLVFRPGPVPPARSP